MNKFKNKVLLITGGTGSFGKVLIDKLVNTNIAEIRVFSRDEKKQESLRLKYNNKKLKFVIGDVRNNDSIDSALNDVDYVFHAAALKQVPTCEFFPNEAFQTNVIGTNNVIQSSIKKNIKKLILLSTDKAVYPINVMGLTKSLAEKLVISNSLNLYKNNNTIICATRYGNVIASRGSVIPLFIDQIKKNKPLTITNYNMSRFIMSLEEAVELVLFAFDKGKNGEIFVQNSPAAKIKTISEVVKEIFNYTKKDKIIGVRHSEKMFETLISSEEMNRCKKIKNFFTIKPDTRDLNYDQFFIKGKSKIFNDFNSDTTKILSNKNLKNSLMKSTQFKELL